MFDARRAVLVCSLLAGVLSLSVVACRDSVAPPAPTLESVSGDHQEAPQGAPLPESLVVRVRDQDQHSLSNIQVRWAGQNVRLSDSLTRSDANGFARVRATLTTRVGDVSVTARLDSTNSGSVRFVATALPTPSLYDTIPPGTSDTIRYRLTSGVELVIPPGTLTPGTELRLADTIVPNSDPSRLEAVNIWIHITSGAVRGEAAASATDLKRLILEFPTSVVPKALDAVWAFSSLIGDPAGFLLDETLDASLLVVRATFIAVDGLQFRAEYHRYDQPECDPYYQVRELDDFWQQGVSVIFIHGWQWQSFKCSDFSGDVAARTFSKLLDMHTSGWVGWPHYDVATYSYPTNRSPEIAAEILADKIQTEFSGRQVILVGHSMGGLVARRAAQLLPPGRLRGIVTLGTPHLGSDLATGFLPYDKPVEWSECLAAHGIAGAGRGDLSTVPQPATTGLLTDLVKLGVHAVLATEGARSLDPESAFLHELNQTPVSHDRVIGFAGDISSAHVGSGSDVWFMIIGHCAMEVEWNSPHNDGVVTTSSAEPAGMQYTITEDAFTHLQLSSGTGDNAYDGFYFAELQRAILNLSPAWVHGQVLAGGQPFTGAVVRLLQSGADIDAAPQVVTDLDGEYAFDLIEPGSYRLRIDNVGGLSTQPSNPYAIALQAGDTLRVDFAVGGALASVSGRVIDGATRVGLPGATVRFLSAGVEMTSVLTDQGGYYGATVAPGTYTLSAAASGYVTVALFNAVITAPSTVLEPMPLVPASPDPGAISGAIQDARTAGGLAGATVELRVGMNALTGPATATTTADLSGQYRFDGLSANTYTVTATANGYLDGFRTGIVVGGAEVPNQDVNLSPAGSTDIRIVLTWGFWPSDLDSHLTGPTEAGTRFHVYYFDKGSTFTSPWAELDVDDVTSYGPETISITQQLSGVYRYSVHDFTDRYSSSSTALAQSGARVDLYRGNTLVGTYFPPATEGTLWTVFELDGAQLTVINRMSYVSDPGIVPSPATVLVASDAATIREAAVAHPKTSGGDQRR